MNKNLIDKDLDNFIQRLLELNDDDMGMLARIMVGHSMMIGLEHICGHQGEDPYPILHKSIQESNTVIDDIQKNGVPDEVKSLFPEEAGNLSGESRMVNLFENAWTSYSDETYDHSVGLVRTRLTNSGFDESFFKGKTCFDGGCGTGRLSIAMALMGAKKVVSADLGGASLEYYKKVIARYGLENIEVVERDVTNLSKWEDESFDFVASNGVLHHTKECNKGLKEHFRITKKGGIFWVYLYGAGGIYWEIYDRLRPFLTDIPANVIRSVLSKMNVREGLIYTYLDNLTAPRVYFYDHEFLDLMKEVAPFEWRHAKGSSEIDDTEILLGTAFGPLIYGKTGEVRMVLTRK